MQGIQFTTLLHLKGLCRCMSTANTESRQHSGVMIMRHHFCCQGTCHHPALVPRYRAPCKTRNPTNRIYQHMYHLIPQLCNQFGLETEKKKKNEKL